MIPQPISEMLQHRVATRLSEQHVTDYQRDGAVCIRQLLNEAEVAMLRDGIEANLAHPSPRAIVASRPDDPGRFFEDFCNWQDVPQYKQLAVTSPLAWVAKRLMQSASVRPYHDHLLVKEPGTRQKTPWHQDQPYYNIDGRQNVSMWIPVDPVARESTLEFVAGSHLGPWLMPRTFMDHQAKWFPEGSLGELPDIEATRGQPDAPHRLTGWALEPGDFVCFHMLTLHAAAGVQGPLRRRVFSLRFIGDDVVHAPRHWKTSPDFPGLAEHLPAGVAMNHPLFPQLLG
jgi:ectoine hydroxylase-related dioxygenase (phytanoyl-CoA dioxygenase family)